MRTPVVANGCMVACLGGDSCLLLEKPVEVTNVCLECLTAGLWRVSHCRLVEARIHWKILLGAECLSLQRDAPEGRLQTLGLTSGTRAAMHESLGEWLTRRTDGIPALTDALASGGAYHRILGPNQASGLKYSAIVKLPVGAVVCVYI
ncbi:hypothetical protein NDU88_003462 [Pleurodeles waltl]|uniref:Uncharacterized protein n=1 Tax=Pleurodeles waltl TaxID=8319 RepID=A0AAV7MSI2_PLEWA|nr:hypothetical protein NDU88_003462 [Pleurodeles waltl]